MTVLIDVVNFNADASCLDSGRWLAALRGGADSQFCNWLRLYIEYRKKMVLGLTGATVADVYMHNPEALALLRGHADIFEPLARPFSHDIAPVRHRRGFERNLDLGLQAIRRELGNCSAFYLPPEFMLSNEQVAILARHDIEAVFVNPARLSHDVRERLPTESYRVRGVGGSSLGCIPVSGEATHCYLSALYGFDAAIWNRFIAKERAPVVITWRDGESAFLIPDGIDREQSWLAGECGCDRGFLTGRVFHYRENSSLDPHCLRAFPAHAFQPWTKEFRMMGFLASLQRIETEAVDFSVIEETLWLHAINSDVLSSVEKRSPVVKAYRRGESHDEFSHTILRSERGFEGEEYLHALACLRDGDQGPVAVLLASSEAYAVKFRGRLDYLRELGHRD